MCRLRLREAAVGRLLHGMHQIGELDGVLDEEHRDVVADEIPVALTRVELDGEPTHVARQVERPLVAGHGGEAHEHLRALAGLLERIGAGDVAERLVALEVAVSAVAAGVDDPLGDALVVEVEDLLPEVEVLQRRRAPGADAQGVLVVGDGGTLLCRQPSPAIGSLVRLPPAPMAPRGSASDRAALTAARLAGALLAAAAFFFLVGDDFGRGAIWALHSC